VKLRLAGSRIGWRVALALGCAAALPLVLTACGSGNSEASYFPLKEGQSWTYRVTKNVDEATEPDIDSLTFTMKGQETLESGPAQRRHSSNGVDYFLRSDDQGIYRVGSRDTLEVNPKADNPPRFVLKKPFVVGTQWQASTMPYVLQRRNEFPKEVRYTTKPIMMVYAIVALNEKVQTPAGQFESCIKVLGEAKIRLYVDAAFNWREIPLFSHEWYCPGVGLARMERIETSPSKFMRGGNVTLDLVSYK
jgi:hypothetical protein